MTNMQKLLRIRISWLLTIATLGYYGWMIREWIHIGNLSKSELIQHEREMSEKETGYRMPSYPHFLRMPSKCCDSRLKINASQDSDFVIRIVDVKTHDIVLDYFLPAGSVREISVPSGVY